MIIGYSFWGFLGPGVLDTPDGGRSHRRPLIDGLRARGHEVVFLQPDRDLLEAGHTLGQGYRWERGTPDIDVLFLEWRWPIPGRNTTACGTPGHTCDLHRQQQLLDHYTRDRRVPTIVWDKDRRLPVEDPLRRLPHVVVCEAALHPTAGAVSLLFPVDDDLVDTADPAALAARSRDITVAYVGNQYDRDEAFGTFFAPAAAAHQHLVAGKWTDTAAWPQIRFTGRVPFSQVARIYRRSVTTIVLLPDRYAAAGQMTQRLPEAVLQGCLPVTPATIRSADRFTPRQLHVRDGTEARKLISDMKAIVGTAEHTDLLATCLQRLDLFRLSRQLDVLDAVLSAATSASTVQVVAQ